MADRTLTINHADGDSETYTLKTEDVLGVRNMLVDGETVTIDRTAPPESRTMFIDGASITISRATGGDIRTIFIDGQEVTINRTQTAPPLIYSPIYYAQGGFKFYQPDGQSLYLQPY